LVKKSVNQDDVSAYHLFYADKLGTPGTDMTFFDWPRIGPENRGTDSIVGTAFRVANGEALTFWMDRLDALSIPRGELSQFAGREILPFEDPEGQRLYLVNDQEADFEGEIWPHPEIPAEYSLRGFYSVVLSVPKLSLVDDILTGILNFSKGLEDQWIDEISRGRIYTTNKAGGPGTEIWLLEQKHLPSARLGAGGVHHVAFRVKDAERQAAWMRHLQESGVGVSQQIDRFWFESIYFRISPGLLFEIATDGPGFDIDEDLAVLGEKLVLPPFLESRRVEIERGLAPI
jgi:glyoxalase family protein